MLSFAAIGLEAKLWIASVGLVVFIFSVLDPQPSFAAGSTPGPLPQAWPWAVFLVLVLFVHFFRPSTFPVWPLADDGRWAFYSLDFSRKWDGRLFWGETQGFPATVWFFGSILKLFPLDALTLRMIPSVVSLLAVAVAYAALRKNFPSSSAFYFCWFLGLGFWPLSFSRMFMGHGFHLILEMGALWALWKVTREPGGPHRSLLALALGLAVGLDCDLATYGATLAAVAALTLLFHFISRGKGGAKYLALFFASCAALAAPVALGEMKTGGMNYLLSQRSGGLNWNYLIALFWDGLGSAPYGPAWGGCFNPIVTSLAFLGLAALGGKERRGMAGWVVFAMAFFLAPGFLSSGAEMFRVLSVLPIVLGLAVLGLESLSRGIPGPGRGAVIGLLLTLSAGMDLYHYFGPYQQLPPVRKIWRNDAYAAMYGRLEDCAKRGTRLGILDFTVNDYDDHTFDVLTRPLNSSAVPDGNRAPVDLIAVVADVHYRPFLEKRFPGGWFSFPEKFEPGDPGWMLGIIPADEMNPSQIGQWKAAAEAFRRLRSQRMYWQRYQPMDPIIRGFLFQEALFKGDPFLESVFWEEGALLFNVQHNLPYALDCYEKAVREGYPAAQLYNEEGALEALEGSFPQAAAAFQKALQAPLNRTAAAANLQAVENHEADLGGKK